MKNKFVQRFESIEAMLEWNTACLESGGRKFEPWDTHGHDWVGMEFASWDDVCAASRRVWEEGVRNVEELMGQCGVELSPPKSAKRRPRWSEDGGDEMCHDRLRSGQEYWRTMRREATRAPRTVTLVARVGAPAHYNTEQLMWSGVACLALANVLENAGYRVEILVVRSAAMEGFKPGIFHAAYLKHAASPLDVATLVASVSNWFTRTAWYQCAFSERKYWKPSQGGVGVMDTLANDSDLIEETIGSSEWYGIDNVFSKEAAIKRVNEIIAAIGE